MDNLRNFPASHHSRDSPDVPTSGSWSPTLPPRIIFSPVDFATGQSCGFVALQRSHAALGIHSQHLLTQMHP